MTIDHNKDGLLIISGSLNPQAPKKSMDELLGIGEKGYVGPIAQSARFNPVEGIKEDTDFVMTLLVRMVGEGVAESVQAKAREVALAQAEAKPQVTLLDLVDAFDRVPELQDFSAALRKAALPGRFVKFFGDEDVSDKNI